MNTSNTSAATRRQLLVLCEAPDATPESIEALLNAGADIEARDEMCDWTPLILAAGRNSNPESIKTLLKAGADIEASDKFGQTPLMHAALHNSNPAIIEALLKPHIHYAARSLLELLQAMFRPE